MSARNNFKGKRIAIIGLGPHGEMVEDAEFLIKAGALVSIYDLRSEARLKSHLVFLRTVGLANYVCGSIPADDLLDMDLIILSHEYSRDATFLKNIEEKKIPIEYPETLFLKQAPPITLVGIMGSHGKATVLSMLAPMLDTVCVPIRERVDGTQHCFVADPESDQGILRYLKDVQSGDILLLRMTGLVMRELHVMRISPQVAIFTTVPEKGTYAETPFEILEYQTYNNYLVASDDIIDSTRKYDPKPRAKMFRTKVSLVPPEWEIKGREHDRVSASLAMQAAQLFKVTEESMWRVLTDWKPLRGRLELVKKVKGVEFYNDTASITPDATMIGLISLLEKDKLTLILGGCDNGCDYTELNKAIPQYVSNLILLPGSGTMKERKTLQFLEDVTIMSVPTMEEAVRIAKEHTKSGDRVLFSPGFAAGGVDVSRKERGERFVKAVRAL